MESFKKLMGNKLKQSEDWDRLEVLYTKFLENKNTEQKIPKKIHQIWLGEMPTAHKKLIPKIINNHPEWEYKLWTFDDIKNYPLINQELFDKTTNLGSKSDILRYEILYNEGGFYLDSDFEMVKSFDLLINNEFVGGTGHVEDPVLFNGLIGCSKNNELIKIVIDKLKNNSLEGDVMYLTGPYHFSSIVFDYIKSNMDKDIVVLPTPYFYPLPATERFKIRGREEQLKDYIYSFNNDNTICIHLWYNSWQ